MSMLVGYGSSDEEEDDRELARPAKKPRLEDDGALQRAKRIVGAHTQIEPEELQEPATAPFAPAEPTNEVSESVGPLAGPTAVPSASAFDEAADTPRERALSPYTAERLHLRELTMPPMPNFDIPDAPDPPPINSEEAAVLAATTKKKFERFLELKKQGVHFNERLQNSASLRNPSLLPKLMEFAEISQEDSYRSTLPEEVGGVPVKWLEECYVENLVKANERREKKRVAEREKVEFVTASKRKSAVSSAAGTPSNGGGGGRKSRFDQR